MTSPTPLENTRNDRWRINGISIGLNIGSGGLFQALKRCFTLEVGGDLPTSIKRTLETMETLELGIYYRLVCAYSQHGFAVRRAWEDLRGQAAP